jgi:peptidoglycan/LPS O-acetylase OafA/YrhL
MTYMPYVDGLRALAIAMVFVFHLNPEWLTGGFIGVDIFFVISGFLITQVIWKAYEKKTFSYLTFLGARCKRLLPAYAFVIICTAVVASFVLLPSELEAFATSVLYAVPFLSNLLFYKKSNYFEDAAETFPLLHTWSLAVEWQFYLLFPLVIFLIHRYVALYVNLVFFFAIVLFALLAGYITEIDPSLVFYISLFRGGEFLIGGLVFFLAKKGLPIGKRAVATLSFCGLCVMAVLLSKEDLFPGYWATLVAVLTGTLLLGMHSDERFILYRCFSSKVVTYIGRISYSFYLWHWPVILFAKYYFGNVATVGGVIGVTFVTFIAALFSYTYVENIFRKPVSVKRVSHYPRSALALYALVLVVPAYALIHTNGLSSRLSNSEKQVLSVPRWQDFPGECHNTQVKDKYVGCVFGEKNKKPKILFWGDSHAQVFAWAYDSAAKELNTSLLSYTKGGCAPLLDGVLRNTIIDKDVCLSMQVKVFQLLEENADITDVILAGRWNGYVGREFVSKDSIISSKSFVAQLNETISALQKLGKRIHFIDTIPQPGYRVPETLVRQRLLFGKSSQSEQFQYLDESVITPELLKGLDKHNLLIYKPKDYLCENDTCSVIDEGNPLYFDADHLSIYGVQKLKKIIYRTLTLGDYNCSRPISTN